MKRFRKCIYTVILLLTCFVASPFIYKQIWKNSSVKEQKAAVKAPTVDTPTPTAGSTNTDVQPTSEGETAPTTQEGEPAAEPYSPEAQITFVPSGTEYFNDALFIGDSRTVGIRDYGTLKNADYFCTVGLAASKIDSADENGSTVWGRLDAKKYGKIYVMLGINEVGNDIEYTVAAYRKLIDGIRQAQPDATVYIQANLHVAGYAETAVISNERINMLNSRLSEMADNKKIFFINVNGVFDDENGALTADYTSDGIHVLAKYYATWCDWLCTNTVSVSTAAAPITTAAPASTEAAQTEAATTSTGLPQNESFSNF